MTDHESAQRDQLHEAVLGPHTTIDQLATSSRSADDARDAFEVIDAFMSVVSRHLASVQSTVLPTAEHRLPDGHDRVSAYLRDARSLEQAVHMLKAHTYGDAHAYGEDPEQLWREIEACMGTHLELERDLVTDLARELSTSDAAALSEQVHAAANNAPTRPHPLTPHAGILGRAARKAWRVADSFWDTAENRVVPHRRKALHPKGESRLTRYFQGRPDFEEPENPGLREWHGDQQQRRDPE
ncbi:MAG TPA: hypothetical protein VFJ14_02035 [Nocardioidaceae bacterium]|nr:hypothetical protein [Nocardioidaceae bacterium]